MLLKLLFRSLFIFILFNKSIAQKTVSNKTMQKVYREVQTPFKYGIVLTAPDSTKMADSPTIFRSNNKWFMVYVIYDGKGYETWLGESDDLLKWRTKGKLMSFTKNTWDANQKAGYPSLIDIKWEGTYQPAKVNNVYWMSYLGGADAGYEAGRLGVGMSNTIDLTKPTEVKRLTAPVLSATDTSAKWYDNKTIFKSSVIEDQQQHTGHKFVMFYNAAGNASDSNQKSFESIAMAVSDDMTTWKRFGDQPVITKGRGICGDAQIVKMDDLYVMFYFGHNWQDGKPTAFDRFACSYDLINWTDWKGANLVEPSAPFDQQYAHKPWMIKWNGVVYHFYNAVGTKGRVIALATSKDLKQ
ncbi:MAG: glycosylase [Chitinophagaceae bacterium]|nr:MAG: glycosylase [Chitinophagaceae bacterium]